MRLIQWKEKNERMFHVKQPNITWKLFHNSSYPWNDKSLTTLNFEKSLANEKYKTERMFHVKQSNITWKNFHNWFEAWQYKLFKVSSGKVFYEFVLMRCVHEKNITRFRIISPMNSTRFILRHKKLAAEAASRSVLK